jgi:hypothetical protein
MPDRRTHRGPHPEDEQLFAADAIPRLQQATADLCWLLSRGYAAVSSLKLVGDRYALQQRQRIAVARSACSDAQLARRAGHAVELAGLKGRKLLVDGYNLLTTIEAALAGGVILAARDGLYRDMASMHGSWRRVAETGPAIELIGGFLKLADVVECHWYLDRPVSNSGRLRKLLVGRAASEGWHWSVELADDPDRVLAAAPEPIATADSVILDHCILWVNLAAELVRARIPDARIVDLSCSPGMTNDEIRMTKE